MKANDVVDLYRKLKDADVRVWVDGGWCVDALLGEHTREHSDLDLAVDCDHADNLIQVLAQPGFSRDESHDDSDWNFVLSDLCSRRIDVHVFHFDRSGRHVYGVAYLREALSGVGVIAGQSVECIAPEWIYRFKTSYQPAEKDLADIRGLCAKFGFPVPQDHRRD